MVKTSPFNIVSLTESSLKELITNQTKVLKERLPGEGTDKVEVSNKATIVEYCMVHCHGYDWISLCEESLPSQEKQIQQVGVIVVTFFPKKVVMFSCI